MILKSFGPRLKSLRKSKNLNQNELSQFLNISRQSYSHYEAGRRIPPVDILADLTILLEYDFFSMFLEASASKFAYSNFQFGSNIIHESEDLTCQKIQKISLLEFSSRRHDSGQATPSSKLPGSPEPPVPPTVIQKAEALLPPSTCCYSYVFYTKKIQSTICSASCLKNSSSPRSTTCSICGS